MVERTVAIAGYRKYEANIEAEMEKKIDLSKKRMYEKRRKNKDRYS